MSRNRQTAPLAAFGATPSVQVWQPKVGFPHPLETLWLPLENAC